MCHKVASAAAIYFVWARVYIAACAGKEGEERRGCLAAGDHYEGVHGCEAENATARDSAAEPAACCQILR